jgi:hypothetical protein
MPPLDSERPAWCLISLIIVGAGKRPFEIEGGADCGAAPKATRLILMMGDNDGRAGLVRQLPYRTQERTHLITEIFAATMELPHGVEDHDPRLEILDHAKEALHPHRILKMQPVTGGPVEGQDVEGGVAMVTQTFFDAGADIANVLFRGTINCRSLLDRSIKERLAQRDRGTQVQGEESLPGLFPPREQAGRSRRENLLDHILDLRELEVEKIVQGKWSERGNDGGVRHRTTAFPSMNSTKELERGDRREIPRLEAGA